MGTDMKKTAIPHLRWYIAILLCFSTELNYLDRQTLSVLADTIQRELGLTTVDYGRITSSFLVSYAIMYAVGGRLIDWLGSRRGLMIFVSGWSIVNMLHALARTGQGDPRDDERALAVGIFNAGTALGSAFAALVVPWIALAWGWRAAFVVTGAIGFVWVIVWTLVYRLPHEHPWLGEGERQLILSDSGSVPDQAEGKVPVGRLLRMPATWGCVMARVLTDPISYFLFFWTPKYFQQERGFNLADIGAFLWIPFVALTLGNLASGGIPRWLIARGWPLSRARKGTMLGVSLAMPVLCLVVTRVNSPTLAVAIMTAIMFGHAAWGNITLPAEVFPKKVVGTVSGLGGALGAVVGAVTQYTIGWVVQNLSFAPVFAFCAFAYLLALGLVHWLIGELGVIRQVD